MNRLDMVRQNRSQLFDELFAKTLQSLEVGSTESLKKKRKKQKKNSPELMEN